MQRIIIGLKLRKRAVCSGIFLPVLGKFHSLLLLQRAFMIPSPLYQKMYFQKYAPDGRTIHYDNCGHTPRIEAIEGFCRTIAEFLG